MNSKMENISEDTENRPPENVRKPNLEGVKKEGNKRRALSVIPSNTDRAQSVTIAKLDCAKHTGLSGKVSTLNIRHPLQSFTIHCDTPDEDTIPKPTEESILLRHPHEELERTATSVALAALPAEEESNTETCTDSPMIIDVPEEKQQQEHRSLWLRNDLVLISEYSTCIYQYLRNNEVKFRPKPQYMRKQPDITHGMRSILIDWLVEVAEEYKLQQETLFLAVSYIDRFLSSMSVIRSRLQLVGTSSMFIASKYQDIYPPAIDEFVYITDDTYTRKQVLRMEQLILKVLAFDLSPPTVSYFLHLFCCIGCIPQQIQNLAQYFCELSLLEADPYLQYLPSVIASSALSLANHTLGYTPWSEKLQQYTGYSLGDLQHCLKSLHASFTNASSYPQQAVRDKYKASKFNCVSCFPPPSTIPC